MTAPYRPCNGTEALVFMDAFCHRCAKDDYPEGDGCPILAASMVYDVDEAGYPAELVRDADDVSGKTARCTAFKARETP